MNEQTAVAADGSRPKSLVTKLAEVMGLVKRIEKTGRNDHFGYSFAEEANILDAVRSALAERHVMIVPSLKTIEYRPTLKGAICSIIIAFTAKDGDTGEEFTFDMPGEAADSGDKGTYKALTGAEKYALMKLFMIPTGNDPERDDVAPVQGVTVHVPLPGAAPANSDAPKPRSTPVGAPALKQAMAAGSPAAPPKPAADFPVRYGKQKGQPLSSLGERDLAYYEEGAVKSVNDPAKARFAKENEQELAAIRAWKAYANYQTLMRGKF